MNTTHSSLHYNIKLKIDPVKQQIKVRATIHNPPDGVFYLHPDLYIDMMLVNGKPVGWRQDTTAAPLQYTHSKAWAVESRKIKKLTLDYCGRLTDTINSVNMITADWTELAYYAAWYPIFGGMTDYTFDIQADLPANYETFTNGEKIETLTQAGRVITTWEAATPGWDMVMMAGPDMHTLGGAENGPDRELVHRNMPAKRLQTMKTAMERAMSQYSEFYGPCLNGGMLRYVYAPRSGWGYSRAPLFVVSDQWAAGEMSSADGMARAMHGCFHEMAHFWWLLANTHTTDDWINEGLAEFSALRLSAEISGQVFADSLLAGYRRNAANSQTNTPIAETEGNSQDRYVNRYEKTTLMFWEAQMRFGQEALDSALKAIYARYAGKHTLTTDQFLAVIATHCGETAAAFFKEKLYTEWVP